MKSRAVFIFSRCPSSYYGQSNDVELVIVELRNFISYSEIQLCFAFNSFDRYGQERLPIYI